MIITGYVGLYATSSLIRSTEYIILCKYLFTIKIIVLVPNGVVEFIDVIVYKNMANDDGYLVLNIYKDN